jgi:hypothetical protein
MVGTMSFEDIYGAGTLDTLPASEVSPTQQKANPNNQETTGSVKPGEEGILNIFKNKNFLGQPLMVWFGIVVLLVGVKYFVEKKK